MVQSVCCWYVFRYIAVTQPIQYAKHKDSKRVFIMLGLTWVISLTISSPIALGMNYTERRLQTPTLCTFYNSDFLIYSSMGSFYIPCVVMLFLYWRVFHAIRQRSRKSAKQRQAQRPKVLPASKDNSARPYLSDVYVIDTPADVITTTAPYLQTTHNDDDNYTDVTNGTFQAVCHDNAQESTFVTFSSNSKGNNAALNDRDVAMPTTCGEDVINCVSSSPLSMATAAVRGPGCRNTTADHKNRLSIQSAGMSVRRVIQRHQTMASTTSTKHASRNANRRERKATKTLAIVLGMSTVCCSCMATII